MSLKWERGIVYMEDLVEKMYATAQMLPNHYEASTCDLLYLIIGYDETKKIDIEDLIIINLEFFCKCLHSDVKLDNSKHKFLLIGYPCDITYQITNNNSIEWDGETVVRSIMELC